ncbi:hypothetical protein M407DRAFT_19928 [Tulasnella calospora MUT 4182]|uniref:Uncharacterized protein n=1 Tax=Tulasnella calospora MUT 4182 TaxID=1051891 RepID=A0A0C3MBC5_9AGAM|nr:hypothetical protein M407DRAFT_19928 [Tulasnella calospora MUT 4182]
MSPTTPTKRVFTEADHALNGAQPPDALSQTYVSQELTASLANVGRKVRQSVQEGYKTDRVLGVIGSRYALDDTNIPSSSSGGATPYIFRSDIDALSAAKFSYSNQTGGLPRFCDSGTEPTWGPAGVAREAGRKRGTRGLDDDEAAEADDLAMDLNAPVTNRLIRAAPRKLGLTRGGTVSMPVGAFSFSGGNPAPLSTNTPAAADPASLLVQPAPGGTAAAPEGVDFGELFNEDF